MSQVVALSFLAAVNPTLVAATTVMLLLPHPSRLMLGYYFGAMLTSVSLGLLIVFSLQGTGADKTTQQTLSPAADIVIGLLLLTISFVIATGRNRGLSERRARRKEAKGDKGPPKWQQALSKGSARTTFVVGALLTLPGASYLAGLHRISELNYSTFASILAVLGFNLVMLLLLEGPVLAFAVAPTWTPQAIDRAKAWVGRHARKVAIYGLGGIGGALVLKGIIGLL
jgi:Sap-like sulfolipid-1-addressing protein